MTSRHQRHKTGIRAARIIILPVDEEDSAEVASAAAVGASAVTERPTPPGRGPEEAAEGSVEDGRAVVVDRRMATGTVVASVAGGETSGRPMAGGPAGSAAGVAGGEEAEGEAGGTLSTRLKLTILGRTGMIKRKERKT